MTFRQMVVRPGSPAIVSRSAAKPLSARFDHGARGDRRSKAASEPLVGATLRAGLDLLGLKIGRHFKNCIVA